MASAMAVGLALTAIGGCTSASFEDASAGIRDTGAYPNLNIPKQAQTSQFSQGEQTSGLAALEAAHARQQAQGAPAAVPAGEAERLRRLGATHGEEALRQIEQ